MKITAITKFGLNDTVFFIGPDYKVASGKIDYIRTTTECSVRGDSAAVIYQVPKPNPHVPMNYYEIPESRCFATKEELLASL